jgi:thiol-disulfide isomerase/thioredoxin
MKYIKSLLLVIPVLLFGCKPAKVYNQLITDEKSGTEILYGYTTLDGLKMAPFSNWFNSGYEEYQPDMETLDQLGSVALNDIEILLVMATWCSDSRREVPRFIKIIDSMGYNCANIKIINVDRKKQAEKTPVQKLEILRVPTFIFKRNGRETGRIIETPVESLEKDMLKIIKG